MSSDPMTDADLADILASARQGKPHDVLGQALTLAEQVAFHTWHGGDLGPALDAAIEVLQRVRQALPAAGEEKNPPAT